MRFSNFKSWVAGLCVLALVGCGGGGGAGNSNLGEGSGTPILGTATVVPQAASIELTLSSTTIPNDGSQTAVVTAVALDSKKNTLAGVPITLSTDSGVLTPGGTVTNASGSLTATLAVGSDKSLRTIAVTAASAGTTAQTRTLQIVNSAVSAGVEPADLLLTLSSPSILSDGSQTITANATALDIKRNVLAGVPVTFSIDQGGTVAPADTTTKANGVLTATVGIGSLKVPRVMTLTAYAVGLKATIQVPVVNNPAPTQPVAADLSLVLSSSTIDNSGAQTIVATVTAVDTNRSVLAKVPVSFKVDGNAIVTPNALLTDSNGVVTASVGIGPDFTNRVFNVTATSGVVSQSKPVSVRGATLSASYTPVVAAASAGNVVSYKLVDVNSKPMAFQAIAISSPSLSPTAGTTDANGNFQFTYDAPNSSTQLRFTASAAGAALQSLVDVVVSGGVPNASTRPEGASLTPSPSVVAVNTAGSEVNQVQLRALFVGTSSKAIPNIRVRFDLNGNPTSTDGVLKFASPYAYSDEAGVARASFIPGKLSSPTDGVTIRACWDLNDFAADQCPNSVQTKLTVVNEALSVAIRTDNKILEGLKSPALTYRKRFVVMVVDAAGQAKAGVPITPSIDLPAYYKGDYVWNGKVWEQRLALASTESYNFDVSSKAWTRKAPTLQPSCPNEDVNRNGVREAVEFNSQTAAPVLAGRQEDLNWNGELDPRKADVAVTMVDGATTDANGLAVVQIEYAKNLASWVDFVITVTASGIGGSEAQAKFSGLAYGLGSLPISSADITDEKNPPAFVISPYGRSTVCTDPN